MLLTSSIVQTEYLVAACSSGLCPEVSFNTRRRTGGKDGEERSTPCSSPHLELGSGGGLHLGAGAREHC